MIRVNERPIGRVGLNENNFIASLDPLGVDDLLAHVPRMNIESDTRALTHTLLRIVHAVSDGRSFDYYTANAAMRDVGILLGSVKRHGIEPEQIVSDLGGKLNTLAAHTRLPPRDTLLHYTVWNPTGARRRTYTGTQDELHLINSVVTAMEPLVHAIGRLKALHAVSVHSQDFQSLCAEARAHFQYVIDGMVMARRHVSPAFFAKELRLYFDPIVLGGKEYLGPGAVEMPMFVFDQLLWSADCGDPGYHAFKNAYLPYVHPRMRDIYVEFEGRNSLLSKCMSEILHGSGSFDPVAYESLQALRLCFQQLKSFRTPHRKVAEEAYDHGGSPAAASELGKEVRHTGSGGYAPAILSHILDLTIRKLADLDTCIAYYQRGRSVRSAVQVPEA